MTVMAAGVIEGRVSNATRCLLVILSWNSRTIRFVFFPVIRDNDGLSVKDWPDNMNNVNNDTEKYRWKGKLASRFLFNTRALMCHTGSSQSALLSCPSAAHASPEGAGAFAPHSYS